MRRLNDTVRLDGRQPSAAVPSRTRAKYVTTIARTTLLKQSARATHSCYNGAAGHCERAGTLPARIIGHPLHPRRGLAQVLCVQHRFVARNEVALLHASHA